MTEKVLREEQEACCCGSTFCSLVQNGVRCVSLFSSFTVVVSGMGLAVVFIFFSMPSAALDGGRDHHGGFMCSFFRVPPGT